MDDTTEYLLTQSFAKIVQRLKDGIIFGQNIDTNNILMLVVGAYYLGLSDIDDFSDIYVNKEIL